MYITFFFFKTYICSILFIGHVQCIMLEVRWLYEADSLSKLVAQTKGIRESWRRNFRKEGPATMMKVYKLLFLDIQKRSKKSMPLVWPVASSIHMKSFFVYFKVYYSGIDNPERLKDTHVIYMERFSNQGYVLIMNEEPSLDCMFTNSGKFYYKIRVA